MKLLQLNDSCDMEQQSKERILCTVMHSIMSGICDNGSTDCSTWFDVIDLLQY